MNMNVISVAQFPAWVRIYLCRGLWYANITHSWLNIFLNRKIINNYISWSKILFHFVHDLLRVQITENEF